ncbi:hypothetical protein HNP60_000829 [Sphingobium sp. B1D3A]|uniref:Uncharacterized protein n=1 Tax=Sphingobium lignivorans TaxID=2735886 RepID=A0ABR6NC45_9SPHN|nr:hypothetical protein [Sphingobium lignivorans]
MVLSADEAGNEGISATIAAIRNDLIAEHLDVDAGDVAARLKAEGSLIRAIEALRQDGRTLVDYELPELSATEEWLADNEILDPEGPDAMFEALSQRSLFKGWRLPWRKR